MALVVEDGTGKADATSFVSRAEYIAYGVARGVTIADADAADVDLVKAMDFLLTKCFRGDPTFPDVQALPFPRHVEDYYGALEFPDDAVPLPVKRAQMDAALAIRSGIDLTGNAAGGAAVKREKVGPIETEYEAGTTFDLASLPAVAAALRPYECGQGGRIRTLRV